jgi:hypothetical protein
MPSLQHRHNIPSLVPPPPAVEVKSNDAWCSTKVLWHSVPEYSDILPPVRITMDTEGFMGKAVHPTRSYALCWFNGRDPLLGCRLEVKTENVKQACSMRDTEG